MALRNTTVRARVNEDLKQEVENVLSVLGLTVSDAINALFSQIKLQKSLPFEVKIPNRTTRKTFEATDKGKGLVHYNDVQEMFDDLGM